MHYRIRQGSGLKIDTKIFYLLLQNDSKSTANTKIIY